MQKITFTLTAIGFAAALAACGGGGETTVSLAPTPSPVAEVVQAASVEGLAAVGAPLPNASVVLKGANGKTLTTTADANGKYRFADVSSLTAPAILQAKGEVAGVTYELHSIATTLPAAGTAASVLNVNPATEAVTAQALGDAPAAVFAASKPFAVDANKLQEAKAKLQAALVDVVVALGLPAAQADLFSTSFSADGKGLDKLLDYISFQTTDAGAGAKSISVGNKSTGDLIQINPADKLADVKPAPAPTKDDLSLDTSGIRSLIEKLSALAKTEKGWADSVAYAALLDDGYLDRGMTKAQEVAKAAKSGNAAASLDPNFSLNGCNAADKMCNVSIAYVNKSGIKGIVRKFVKQGSDGIWRGFGDRLPFDFDVYPVANVKINVSSSKVPGTPTVESGYQLYLPTVQVSEKAYVSAKIQSSNDNGATWSQGQSFVKSVVAGCTQLSTSPSLCSSFYTLPSDADVAASNAAMQQGKFKVKITAVKADSSVDVHEFKSQVPGLTSATATAAFEASGLLLPEPKQLGTAAVTYSGKPWQIQARVRNGVNNTGVTTISDNSLSGSITTSKLLEICTGNSSLASCNAVYGSGSTIVGVFLDGKDALGRSIWVNYQLQDDGRLFAADVPAVVVKPSDVASARAIATALINSPAMTLPAMSPAGIAGSIAAGTTLKFTSTTSTAAGTLSGFILTPSTGEPLTGNIVAGSCRFVVVTPVAKAGQEFVFEPCAFDLNTAGALATGIPQNVPLAITLGAQTIASTVSVVLTPTESGGVSVSVGGVTTATAATVTSSGGALGTN